MIQSMTGFGRAEQIDEDKKLVVEMKSVNHRYADFTIKMPRRFNRFEAAIRGILQEYISRGKVDVFITYQNYRQSDVSVKYNRDIAEEYIRYFREMKQEFPEDLADTSAASDRMLTPGQLGRFPEVFSLEESPQENDDALFEALDAVLREACKSFVKARSTEGENLVQDLLEKVDTMEKLVDRVEELSPRIQEAYRPTLSEKVKEFLERGDVDENRIAAEVTIFADKICVDEEMVRLKSHIKQTRNILKNGGAVGRQLDFIIQEMNREANTTLSKAGAVEITDIGIELKTLIEKIREQVQNLE